MDRAAVPLTPSARPAFRDGLGERRFIADPAGNETLEQLCLRSELASVPSFEFALRERVSRLATFRHEQFARARSVERLSDRESTLAIVSERVNGVRLSTLLQDAEQRRLGLDITAALCIIRQLVPAVAALHESAREVAHGVIGPERLLVTPEGQLIVTEYVLGAALEQLRYPRERYWSELRVALPSSAGLPRFDQRADVTQIGVVALSLILGRLMRDDEYPARIADVVASTWAISPKGGFEPLPAGLRAWLGRALQLDARSGFASAIEARLELEKVLIEGGEYSASTDSLDAFLARYHGVAPQAPPARPSLATIQPAVAPLPPATAKPAAPPPVATTVSRSAPAAAASASTPPRGTPTSSISPIAAPTTVTPPRGTPMSTLANAPTPPLGTPIPGGTHPRAAASSTYAPPSHLASAPTPVPTPGFSSSGDALTIQSLADSVSTPSAPMTTPPRGLPISAVSGSSSATVSIPATAPRRAVVPAPKPVADPPPSISSRVQERGQERVQEYEDEPRSLSKRVGMMAALVALVIVGAFTGWTYLKPEPVVVTDGTLVITTNPSGAQVLVDGRARGVTPLTLTLPAGSHRLELRAGGGSRAIPINITAGTQATQYIELPQAPSGFGQLQVRTEPAGAKVSVDGVAKGTSPTTVAQLTPGEHTVMLESELGSIKQTVTIEAGMTAQLLVPMTAPEGAPVSGWISVASPVELHLFEGDRLLGTSRSDRIMVSAGRHDIDLVNETYGYRATRSVQVAAGKVATLNAEMPSGTIALNALPWAEVWIDGTRIGETPIGNHQLPIGAHDLLFRHPELGEQQHKVVVTVKEVTRLSVDMRKR